MITIHLDKYNNLVVEQQLGVYLAQYKVDPNKATFEFRGNLVHIYP
jgi:hypothetical protein